MFQLLYILCHLIINFLRSFIYIVFCGEFCHLQILIFLTKKSPFDERITESFNSSSLLVSSTVVSGLIETFELNVELYL